MPNMWMDDEAKALLDVVKEEIATDGIKNPSYGDAVRRLVRISKSIQENHKQY